MAQSIMSNTASNYDVFMLLLGSSVATVAAVVALGTLLQLEIKPWTTCIIFLGVTIMYSLMTFASSYVEEEQHFWYWTSTTWLALLWIKGYVGHTAF